MKFPAIYSSLVLLVLQTSDCKAQLSVIDSFESKELSPVWATDRMVKESFQIQSKIVRKGHSAVKITLRSGDIFEKGLGKSLDSERDELCEADNVWSLEGKLYEFSFSLFLPDSFPIVPTRLVIAQWKQKCTGDSLCSDDSPVMAIRYVRGRLYITVNTESGSKTVFATTEEIRNKWLDFKFRVRFSRTNNGTAQAWLNNREIVKFQGINCYSSKKGYPEKSQFYFKTGLYRDLMKEPMSIYIDEYSKKEMGGRP